MARGNIRQLMAGHVVHIGWLERWRPTTWRPTTWRTSDGQIRGLETCHVVHAQRPDPRAKGLPHVHINGQIQRLAGRHVPYIQRLNLGLLACHVAHIRRLEDYTWRRSDDQIRGLPTRHMLRIRRLVARHMVQIRLEHVVAI